MTLRAMIEDLKVLIMLKEKYGDYKVTLSCHNCSCHDDYNGAVVNETAKEVFILINKD